MKRSPTVDERTRSRAPTVVANKTLDGIDQTTIRRETEIIV
jgi:hypothetical protein